MEVRRQFREVGSLYHMGPENQTLIDIFDSKHFDLLKHLTSLAFVSFEY